jgi:RNA polymerase sigma-70 factor (ECF subfamily)
METNLGDQETVFSTQRRVRRPWRKFLDSLEPERPRLHRYCYGLTGNVWDAEDLVQDVLLRVFGQLGKVDGKIKNPRAYLIRTATHLWIDRVRRANVERTHLELEAVRSQSDSNHEPVDRLEVRDAAETFIDLLAPQERAAVLMKDVFDLSLEEIASTLKTSVGAVKAALHRGRGTLKEDAMKEKRHLPPPELVEQFMAALRDSDSETLQAICLRDITVELVGGIVMDSLDESESFFKHAHMEFPAIGFGKNPNWKTIVYRGETIVVGFRTLGGVEGINEFHRIEEIDGKISALRCYCFCPDTLRTVADELGLVALDRPYRSPTLGTAIQSVIRYALGRSKNPASAGLNRP